MSSVDFTPTKVANDAPNFPSPSVPRRQQLAKNVPHIVARAHFWLPAALKSSPICRPIVQSCNLWLIPPSRIRCRIRFRNRFRKNRAHTCCLCRCCWGLCAAIARHAEEPGRRVSRAKEWAELQARTNGRYEKNRTRSYMNGWTATANLRKRKTLFLRKLRSYYEILTDECHSYVLCYGNGYSNGCGNGYVTVETRQ